MQSSSNSIRRNKEFDYSRENRYSLGKNHTGRWSSSYGFSVQNPYYMGSPQMSLTMEGNYILFCLFLLYYIFLRQYRVGHRRRPKDISTWRIIENLQSASQSNNIRSISTTYNQNQNRNSWENSYSLGNFWTWRWITSHGFSVQSSNYIVSLQMFCNICFCLSLL